VYVLLANTSGSLDSVAPKVVAPKLAAATLLPDDVGVARTRRCTALSALHSPLHSPRLLGPLAHRVAGDPYALTAVSSARAASTAQLNLEVNVS
jgi:hypothetical protein